MWHSGTFFYLNRFWAIVNLPKSTHNFWTVGGRRQSCTDINCWPWSVLGLLVLFSLCGRHFVTTVDFFTIISQPKFAVYFKTVWIWDLLCVMHWLITVVSPLTSEFIFIVWLHQAVEFNFSPLLINHKLQILKHVFMNDTKVKRIVTKA